jgi:hypothetical protein
MKAKRSKRREQADAHALAVRGKGRRAPHWVREFSRLGLGERGQCNACSHWGTLKDGLCGTCAALIECAAIANSGSLLPLSDAGRI